MLRDTYHQLWELLRAFIDLAHASAGKPTLITTRASCSRGVPSMLSTLNHRGWCLPW